MDSAVDHPYPCLCNLGSIRALLLHRSGSDGASPSYRPLSEEAWDRWETGQESGTYSSYWGSGDPEAVFMKESLDKLYPEVYEQLRAIASKYMRGERLGHTLQATALVNEAYKALSRNTRIQYRDHAQLLGHAAGAMWRILVEHARKKSALKRGRGWIRVHLSGLEGGSSTFEIGPVAPDQRRRASETMLVDIIVINQALERLRSYCKNGPRMVQAFELRSLGFTDNEVAGILGVSSKTVQRDRDFTESWLRVELSGEILETGGG